MSLPDNYREQPDLMCCASCQFSTDDSYDTNGLYCDKHSDYVDSTRICDDWEKSW